MPLTRCNRRRAVAPVLATLLMIAVAVAMSVIIFMWSQGFLANTSTAAGSQQGAQNQAAQSSIMIEEATFSGTCATAYIRNVGTISVTLGLGTIQGLAQNAGYTTFATAGTGISTTAAVAKGGATTVIWCGLSGLASGDVMTLKVTTKVGTFVQATFTVP